MEKYLTKLFSSSSALGVSAMLRIMDYLYSVHPKVVTYDELLTNTGLNSKSIETFTKRLKQGNLIHIVNGNEVMESCSFVLDGKAVNIYLQSNKKITTVEELLTFKFDEVWPHLTVTDRDRIVRIVYYMKTLGGEYTSSKELREKLRIPKNVCYSHLGLLQRADIVGSKTNVYKNPNEKGYFLTLEKAINQYNAGRNEVTKEPKPQHNLSDLLDMVHVPKEPDPIEAITFILETYVTRLKALEDGVPVALKDINKEFITTLYNVANELNERLYKHYYDMESRVVRLEQKFIKFTMSESIEKTDIEDMVSVLVKKELNDFSTEVKATVKDGVLRGYSFEKEISRDYESIYGSKKK